MSSLTGSTISSTYQSLLKIDGNNTLSATLRNITDGVGNITPISMSTTLLNISTAFKLSSYGTGTRTGTATYNLAVDSVGNVIEVAGGGGGQNPSANIIPLNNGTSSFVDSNIENDANNYLKTSVNPTSGDYFGLFIDFGNYIATLGDINFGYGTKLQVNDNNKTIFTSSQGNDIGLKLDFANNIFQFGDWNGTSNNTYIEVDDSNEQIKFKANNILVFQGANLLESALLNYTEKNIKVIAPDGNTYYIPLYN
jgi:hypothetical protein